MTGGSTTATTAATATSATRAPSTTTATSAPTTATAATPPRPPGRGGWRAGMSVPVKLAAFAGLLGLVFGGAALVGAVLDPTDERSRPAAAMGGHADTAGEGTGMTGQQSQTGAEGGRAAGGAPAGLAVSEDGYTLRATQTSVPLGEPTRFAFSIDDREGHPVRAGYELESQRELHLIVVRRDATQFQHLHPARDSSGVWSTTLTVTQAGVYRAYADFTIDGRRHTLATDLFAPGDFRPIALPPAAGTAEVDGYTVTLPAGPVRAGEESSLAFRVTRDGRPVDDLGPYLGAKGHLVALRAGDLAYLHVHPDDAAAGGAEEIRFMTEFPTAGRYRLFLQFSVGGQVRTAAHTLEVVR